VATWKRICCAVDFSPASRSAADEAAELGWRFGGTVTLLHVLEPPPTPAPDLHLPSAAERAKARAERERELEDLRIAVEHTATTRVEAVLAEGDPAPEIVRFAAERGYHVIVVGTHGRGRGPLGSVAAQVALNARCPVVVVPDDRLTEARAARDAR
jgi:nucleotide-binding universal stress UspA family protein